MKLEISFCSDRLCWLCDLLWEKSVDPCVAFILDLVQSQAGRRPVYSDSALRVGRANATKVD